jgi:hypothetical protein
MKNKKRILILSGAAVAIVAVAVILLYELLWKPAPLEPVPIDEAHFPDEDFRDYIRWSYDRDDDGVLSDKEIQQARDFDVAWLVWHVGVSHGLTVYQTQAERDQFHVNLKGLEHLCALETIDVSAMNLEELDVSCFPKLRSLECIQNRLTKLDVSHNPALKHLECWENNLTELDVSQNPALEYLKCSGNDLTELDVSHNPELVMLNCVHCNINTLNLGDKPSLYRLECIRNKLSVLDLSGCPIVNDVYYDEGVEVLGVPAECLFLTPYVETTGS